MDHNFSSVEEAGGIHKLDPLTRRVDASSLNADGIEGRTTDRLRDTAVRGTGLRFFHERSAGDPRRFPCIKGEESSRPLKGGSGFRGIPFGRTVKLDVRFGHDRFSLGRVNVNLGDNFCQVFPDKGLLGPVFVADLNQGIGATGDRIRPGTAATPSDIKKNPAVRLISLGPFLILPVQGVHC